MTLDDELKGLRAGMKPRDRVFAGRVRRRTFLGGLESSLKFRGGEGAVRRGGYRGGDPRPVVWGVLVFVSPLKMNLVLCRLEHKKKRIPTTRRLLHRWAAK